MSGTTSTVRGERGAATVYALVVAALVMMACVIAMQIAAIARLQHTVAAAADLAALAASQSAASGEEGCAAARTIAHRNHAEVASCRMDAEVATVQVAGTSPRIWGRTWTITRAARAGPSDYVRQG